LEDYYIIQQYFQDFPSSNFILGKEEQGEVAIAERLV